VGSDDADPRGVTLERLEAEPRNEAVIAALRPRATPREGRGPSDWNLEGYELHTHPDVGERLGELVGAVPALRVVPLLGYIAAARDDVVVAVGEGTGRLALRLAASACPAELEPKDHPEFGDDWCAVEIWQTDLSTERGRELLVEALERTADALEPPADA
jgi:hypothetical protein